MYTLCLLQAFNKVFLPSFLPIPPWERPALGHLRRRPISRRNRAVREQYVRTLANDKAPDEIDIFTDASMNGTTAAVAWTCPDIPQLNGSRNITNTYGLTDEAELFGILGAIQTIQSATSFITTNKFRVITDSHVALRELNRSFSPNSTATNILYKIRDLTHEGFKIRLVWTPAHTYGADGNHSAHNAARECLRNPPMVPVSIQGRPEPQQACEMDWQQKYRRIKNLSRQRLADASPPGFLAPLQSLPRTGEIFANKVYADSAYTPDVISKWTTHRHLASPRCPYCGSNNTPNLFHLIWACSAYSTDRDQFLTTQVRPTTSEEHVQHVRNNPQILQKITEFGLKTGLYKVV